MKQLKERLASRGENFPSDVTKTKNRFKKCAAECKKAALAALSRPVIRAHQKWLRNPPAQTEGESPETVGATETRANSHS